MAGTNNINKKRIAPLTMEQAFAMNNNQIPPQIIDIEESVLGALIIDDDALTNTIDKIHEEYFYKQENKDIFNAIYSLSAEGKDIDLLTVGEKLKKMGVFDSVGGSYKLATLVERIASAAHIETYVRMLAEKYIQRELIRVSTQTLKNAYLDTTDILSLLDETETNFLAINDVNFNSAEKSMPTLAEAAIKEIEEAQKSDSVAIGLESGFMRLDEITGGFQPGQLIILAARPAMGKTAFALNMARNMAVDFGRSIAIFSLEMTANELMMRLISTESEIQGQKLKRGDQLSTMDLEKVKSNARKLAECKMFIDDNPGLNIMELKAKCKRMKKKHDIDMIFIDYLQLMSGGGDGRNTNREQEISTISRQLKGLAKELNIPVLALSQLSREVEKRGGSKEPMLADLRESGAIEQDADIVMFIYRPSYYGINEDNEGSTQNIAYINVEKNRAGGLAKARLKFEGEFVKFSNIEANNGITKSFNSGFDSQTPNVTILESKSNSSFADNIIPQEVIPIDEEENDPF